MEPRYFHQIHSKVKTIKNKQLSLTVRAYIDLVILGVIIVVVSVIGAIGAFVRNRWLIYTYMLIILASLVFQVMIGVQVYQKAANRASYLSDIWTFSSYPYRSNLQEQVKYLK